jgi:biopolymer transport protein ExbD
MASVRVREDEFGLQIAPMLDILFVLLLFFMVAAGTQKREASIVTHLPGSARLSPITQVPVLVTIDADGQVDINGSVCDAAGDSALPETINRLRAIVAENPGQPVYITPTPSTRQQRVVDVLNACTAAGVKNLAFGSSS